MNLYLSIVPAKGRLHLVIASGIVATRRTQCELIGSVASSHAKHRLELVCHCRDRKIRWARQQRI